MADRSLTRRIAALGTLAVVAYAALAAVQILVLNPLAAVPGRTGMALADSFGISGGDHAPWALPLYIASALALVALVTLAVWPRRGAEGAAGVPSAPR